MAFFVPHIVIWVLIGNSFDSRVNSTRYEVGLARGLLPRQSVGRVKFVQKRRHPRSPLLKTIVLMGNLIFDNPFLDSRVVGHWVSCGSLKQSRQGSAPQGSSPPTLARLICQESCNMGDKTGQACARIESKPGVVPGKARTHQLLWDPLFHR